MTDQEARDARQVAPHRQVQGAIDEVARELGLSLGDQVVWDVQGLAVPSRVARLVRTQSRPISTWAEGWHNGRFRFLV